MSRPLTRILDVCRMLSPLGETSPGARLLPLTISMPFCGTFVNRIAVRDFC